MAKVSLKKPPEAINLDSGKEAPLILRSKPYRGENRIDVRHQWFTDDGSLAPTKKGINIPVSKALPIILQMVEFVNYWCETEFVLAATTDHDLEVLQRQCGNLEGVPEDFEDV